MAFVWHKAQNGKLLVVCICDSLIKRGFYPSPFLFLLISYYWTNS